jgi:hypothetical protein
MSLDQAASRLLANETRALLTRLGRVKPFVLQETLVPAAAGSPAAQSAIERYLAQGRFELRRKAQAFLRWLHGPQGNRAAADEAQRRFTFLKMQFNLVLSQFDIFADVITQRSEHETGVWLAGLDVVAADALALPGGYYVPPPVMSYLDRGVGAAIRRARTRLPGGGENPIAIVRVPRERMVGSGIASSLVHEVGHQAAALLDLVHSMRGVLRGLRRGGGADQLVLGLWERWISEILADFWSVARVGVASTTGLMGVVSLPRAFVFRVSVDDPHPIPWIRVKLSIAIGEALYPDPQWRKLAALWEAFYPLNELSAEKRRLFATIEAGIPSFVTLLVNHRPSSLHGLSLREALAVHERQPARLRALYQSWRTQPALMQSAPPSLVFAVVGQARADGRISPEEESRLIGNLLTYWAMRSTLDTSVLCAEGGRARATALIT